MKYIPSIAFEEMSGSAKGVTAAKVKGRKFIRNRGYGGRVGTADQAKNQGVMKMITTSWKSLTNEQILAWNKLALSQDAKSVLGTKGKISGLNLFQRLLPSQVLRLRLKPLSSALQRSSPSPSTSHCMTMAACT